MADDKDSPKPKAKASKAPKQPDAKSEDPKEFLDFMKYYANSKDYYNFIENILENKITDEELKDISFVKNVYKYVMSYIRWNRDLPYIAFDRAYAANVLKKSSMVGLFNGIKAGLYFTNTKDYLPDDVKDYKTLNINDLRNILLHIAKKEKWSHNSDILPSNIVFDTNNTIQPSSKFLDIIRRNLFNDTTLSFNDIKNRCNRILDGEFKPNSTFSKYTFILTRSVGGNSEVMPDYAVQMKNSETLDTPMDCVVIKDGKIVKEYHRQESNLNVFKKFFIAKDYVKTFIKNSLKKSFDEYESLTNIKTKSTTKLHNAIASLYSNNIVVSIRELKNILNKNGINDEDSKDFIDRELEYGILFDDDHDTKDIIERNYIKQVRNKTRISSTELLKINSKPVKAPFPVDSDGYFILSSDSKDDSNIDSKHKPKPVVEIPKPVVDSEAKSFTSKYDELVNSYERDRKDFNDMKFSSADLTKRINVSFDERRDLLKELEILMKGDSFRKAAAEAIVSKINTVIASIKKMMKEKLRNGVDCKRNDECESNNCENGKCTTKVTKKEELPITSDDLIKRLNENKIDKLPADLQSFTKEVIQCLGLSDLD